MHRLAPTMVAVAALAAALAAAPAASRVPDWTLRLRISHWVAPSRFAATVTGQTTGLKVRRGLPVTLVLDRRTRCRSLEQSGRLRVVRCARVRPELAHRGVLSAEASGQFETGHLGTIGFRVRTLTLR